MSRLRSNDTNPAGLRGDALRSAGGLPSPCGGVFPPRWRRPPPATLRYRTSPDVIGQQEILDGLTCWRAALQRSRYGDAEVPVQHAGRHFPRGHWRAVPDGIGDEGLRSGPWRWPRPRSPSLSPKVDADRLRRPSSPPTGLKPIADELRNILPFGSPKRGGQHEQTRRNTGGDARSQVDPPHGGTRARAPRQGRWRDQSPLWVRGYMDGAALLATNPPLAALREARLNGFRGARAVVRRHCIGGSRRRVSDTSPTGSLDAAKEAKPAYPLSYNRAGEGMAPAPPSNPPRVALPRRSRMGAPPPAPRVGAA